MHASCLQGERIRQAFHKLDKDDDAASLLRPQNTSYQIISWLHSRNYRTTGGMQTVAVSAKSSPNCAICKPLLEGISCKGAGLDWQI